MNTVLEFIVSIIITLETIFSLTPNIFGQVKSYAPEGNGIILNCAVVSDTHADRNNFRDRTNNLRMAYAGIRESCEDIDVLLNIGDITNSGTRQDYATQKLLQKVYIKAKHTVACLGNHDSWNESADPDYPEAKRLFLKYLKHNGIESENVYYSEVIDGYYFICLGTEALDLHENLPVYSDEQLSWFSDTLDKATESGLPVFVLSHLPLSGHNGIGGSNLPSAVDDILKSHADYDKPILFFSGHCHTFSPAIFEQSGNVCYINMPSVEYNDETEYECNDKGGMGMTMEVYSNRIILKARNFIKDEWAENYRFVIEF